MEHVLSSDEFRALIGPNVKRLRSAKGMSQAQLADICGCRVEHISRVENGVQSPSGELVFALADALDVAADVLRRPQLPQKVAQTA